MANILPVSALGWSRMHEHWWQFFLIGIFLASVTVGCVYTLYSLVKKSINWLKSRPTSQVVPKDVAKRLEKLSNQRLSLYNTTVPKGKPSSFGVYLGGFTTPPTQAQSRLLAQWELLIVNPFQTGVADAISKLERKHVLGRLELDKIISTNISTLAAIEKIENSLSTNFNNTNFSGVLFANWENVFTPPVLKKLVEAIGSLGLSVYLETAPPDFLTDGKVLQSPAVAGLVIKNASVLPRGEKRDYFQMLKMKPTIKAFVSEACMRDFVVLAWETVDDDVELANAVVRRSMQWCNFYSALTWIGTGSALEDATLNIKTLEPLPAFGWLKEANVMNTHDIWRSNLHIGRDAQDRPEWDTLLPLFPALRGLLASAEYETLPKEDSWVTLREPPEWVAQIKSQGSPLSISMFGMEYKKFGCIPLGSEPTPLAFAEILQSQIRLKNLGLLHPVPSAKVQDIGALLKRFYDSFVVPSWTGSKEVAASIKELVNLASKDFLRVNLGLDSGLRKTPDARFWAVYQMDLDGIEIFASKNAQGLAGTVLHTFLSAKGYSRHDCFVAETALGRWSDDLVDDTGLPRRLVQDIDVLSPEERLLLLQHLSLTDAKDELSETICAYIRRQLIDAPSLGQLKELNTVGYVGGTVSPEALINSRVTWYQEQGCQYPSRSKCLDLFNEVDSVLTRILKERREADLASITESLCGLVQKQNVDAYVDMMALALFCAARKGAFDEIYNEVTDRNPLFNVQSDQAAAFAESFALGSRCEAYFDVSPSVFGKLLSDRFREYYSKNQPPSWINGAPEMATSYAGAQMDVNPDDKVKAMPSYQRVTFLSVFAIPALIDIILLTIIGRGLYLSTSMSYNDQQSATIALMIALLLSGAVGTWIAVGGSYYLISMAFAVANMFVLIRLFAVIALTIVGGLIGFICISSVNGPVAGVVFWLYLISLTIYFTAFAALASFSYPGSSFLSGRKVILLSVPVLFVSPIITTFAGHDTLVYLIFIYVFIIVLLLGLRDVASKWVTWYQKIRRTDDTEIRKWYIATYGGNDEKVFGTMSDPAVLKLSREALYRDILAETKRGFFSKRTSDKLVSELARDWEATNFLLNWYCRYADVPRPIPFSSSWNINTKVALGVLGNSQKGLRLHNAFMHWRQSSTEIGCGVLYFILALLDKWVDLLTGEHNSGLAPGLTNGYRMPVGFGLVYYLIGAVLIDVKAQELNDFIGSQNPVAVKTSRDIRGAQKRDVRLRRQAYWRILFKYLMYHVWSLALATALLSIFESSWQAMAMFCAYVLSYTGLLWYQYTKIFSGPHALKPLLAGVVVGLAIGIGLKVRHPHFVWTDVIALGSATWTVAILTMWTAKMGMPPKVDSPVELGKTFHAFTSPWDDPEWSQQELQTFYENLATLPADTRLKLDPSDHPGVQVKALLESRKEEPRIEEAFPNSKEIVNVALTAWAKGEIILELVPQGSLGPGIRALTCNTANRLNLAIGVGRGMDQRIDISANCQIIAEVLIHAVAEAILRIPHEYAVFSESIVIGGVTETMARQLREEANTQLVIRWGKKELLRQLCLGFEPDSHWDKLPKKVRMVLLNRCLGQPCQLTESQWQWLKENLCRFDTDSLDVHVGRCNLGAATAVSVLDYAFYGTGEEAMPKDSETMAYISYVPRKLPVIQSFFKTPFSYMYHSLGTAIKFIVIALVAEPEFQREFHHVMELRPAFVRVPCVFILSLIWMYAKKMQDLGLMFYLFHGRDNVKQLWEETKGNTITIKKNRFIVQGLDGTYTAFKHPEADGGFKLFYYVGGAHKTEPDGTKLLKYVCTYSQGMLLHVRQEFKNGELLNEYHYDYRTAVKKGFKLSKDYKARIPMGRRCVKGENHHQSVQYNRKGLIEAGSYMKDGNLVRFKYHYRKNPRFGDELLRAEFVLTHISCTVSWCVPPLRQPEKVHRWIPHSKVTEATFVQGADVYESRWLYDHKFHPTIFTTLNGQKLQTPPMIENDFLGVLEKPKYTSFVHDNPLVYCDSLNSNIITRALGLTRKRFPVSTSRARSLMWKAWKERVDFDGIMVRWLDDRLLRRDKSLGPYWRCRDRGNLKAAKDYLSMRADAVMASTDLDDHISSWTPLAVKISDLVNFGPGGDAPVYTRSKDFGSDTEKTLHVMAADTGTWPNEGGGVSACRRDMINSLKSIKWHMICESANDSGTPKHQTEQNVQSLKMVPLWGLDFLTPTHGLFRNKLDAEVDDVTSASEFDIKMNFIPILTALVKGARAVHLSKPDIHQATRALVNLNTYFQDSRHWTQVWKTDMVKESWRDLWLTQEMENTLPSSKWFDTELPTLGALDTALELWFRYLFIFSIPIPEKIPSVFQASHHSVSASYGVVCKIKRKCTLQIWDHAISWRETNLCLSSALCTLSPFVRNALLGLMRITSVVTLHHADIILPCADFFNPGWEVEIGTCQGTIEHRNTFRRKVDPVVNGITDMQKFSPVKEIKSEHPTVTMLSHVWYAKDIKIALLAADIIINQWGFDDYHLDIYGAIDKAPTYSTECQELLASKGLRGKVTLRGTADPMKVLENTWLFLNSSLSEGLPLALGEAALTGAPVVCTDVGASLRVLSDPDDFSRFSAVVAPNDAQALARAQIHMLALLGEWSKYTEDAEPAPVLTSSPTPEEVAKITRRMYEKSSYRRKLGMMTRNIVQKSFSGDRYLREHEQMLWIGKAQKLMASRFGPEPMDLPTAIKQTAPIEEDVITIPRSAINSWRSSAASGLSTLYSTVSNYPMLGGPHRPSSVMSGTSNASTDADSFLRLPSSFSLPVFAPRGSAAAAAAIGGYSSNSLAPPVPTRGRGHRSSMSPRSGSPAGRDQLRGLVREEPRPYRNSDVSSIMRDDFLRSFNRGGDA